MLPADTIQAIAALGRNTTDVRTIGDELLVVGDIGVIKSVARESGCATPTRSRGTTHTTHPQSLIEHVRPHLTSYTRLYVIADKMQIAVVLNDDDDQPGWRDWVTHMTLTATPGWLRWVAANRQLLDQTKFAELIEDGLSEIIEPDGADLLELAQSFHASTSAAFRGGQRLTSGAVSFTYTEEVTATAGSQGQIEVPSRITLSLTPFYGAEPRRITARFRFRLNAGKLQLGFIIDGLEELLRDVMDDIADEVAEALQLRPIYVAAVPAPVTPRH